VGRLIDQMKASGLDRAPIEVLAISGGGENGAYGAGLLCGWSELGTRPTFNVVTGVSTGALTAPFAFLGSDYDEQLKTCYTTLSTSELVTDRGLLEGLGSDALSDPDGLREMLSTQFDEKAYRRMGEEHLKGRRLFVGTTNLDRMEPSYWCLSAIAAEDLPGGRQLALDIILASASIPGVFPPVMIEVVASDGRTYDEMHVDGGVSAQVFTYPVALRLRESEVLGDDRRGMPTVWVIRNAPLVFRYEQVPRSLFDIAGRSISGLIRSNGIGDLYRIWITAIRDGFDFRLASIPFDFDVEPSEPFDPVHMKALFERGRSDILTGEAWRDHPPQIDAADVEALRTELNGRAEGSDRP
jgi:predicted acylesterase/phospholipase RssA